MNRAAIRSTLIACVVAVATLQSGAARGDVVLSPNDVVIDYRGPSSADGTDLWSVAVESAPVISALPPVPGFTGVKVSETKVTWTFLESYADPNGFFLTLDIVGSASGLVTSERVLVEWDELHASGPGLWSYGVYANLMYADETLDEGFGGDANGNPDGALWLHTLVGNQNGLDASKYTLRVEMFFVDPVAAGDQFTLAIRGHSLDAGTASVVNPAVPEPGLMALCALGLAATAGTRRARRPAAACRRSFA
jgi:hypothetical protein